MNLVKTSLALLALGVVAACAPEARIDEETPEAAAGAPYPAQQALTRFDPQVDELLARMTLDEKVGQMTQADISYIEDPADVAKYFLGSVLSGGSSDPEAGNSPEAWREMYDGYQRQALSTRLGIPILYGVDAVHGHANVIGAVVFPHHIGLGATRDAELVEEVYRATAREVRATGIQWSFAPCVAVARDIRWGRTYESFSEDPELAAELAAAAVRGLHGRGLGEPEAVVACAKHFLADGGTTYGTGAPKEAIPDSVFEESGQGGEEELDRWPVDRGDAHMQEAELRAIHLPPYLSALEEGVASIMPSFSSWNGVKMSASHHLLTEVLKEELGFEGFLISDWGAIDEIPGDYESDVVTAINAGMDMVMVPERYQEFFDTLKGAVEAGKVPVERIDDAVRRILRVKFAAGLMAPERPPLAAPELLDVVGAPEHRALGRRAVRESMVLLENEGGALPLAKDAAHIHVTGKSADDIGNQSGGWTVQWQGGSGEITEGTTILEAIRNAVAPGTRITTSADGSGGQGAAAVVVVIGETPYAEMLGDRTDLSLDEADAAAVRAAAATGSPVITVLVSGRPLILGEVLDLSDAVLAAWLPGSEGDGVADVLFGDYAPTGKLPFSWPRSIEQLPLHAGDEGYDPLFPFGHGLGYGVTAE